MAHNTIFLKKNMCCGKCVTTHYFLSHNTLFFQKKYSVADMDDALEAGVGLRSAHGMWKTGSEVQNDSSRAPLHWTSLTA